jgi:hypothetical protein
MSGFSDQEGFYLKQTLGSFTQGVFPELRDQSIEVVPLKTEYDYFAVDVENIFKSLSERKYLLQVNPLVFSLQIPKNAFEAVMVRELALVAEYIKRDSQALFFLNLEYIFLGSSQSIIDIERQADRMAVQKGFGPGLISYRNWLYEQIPANRAVLKKKIYLSNDEMRQIQAR